MKTLLRFLFIGLLLAGLSASGQDYYNILDSKPKPGTGVTDDNNVIRKALETYKSVFFPRTSTGYKITGTLVIPAGCRLVFDVGAKFIGTGTINGNSTQIVGQGLIFASTLSFSGTFQGPYVDANWFQDAADYTTFKTLITTGIDMATSADLDAPEVWAKIDTAWGSLDMNGNHINDVWTLSAENVSVERNLYFIQEEHRVGVVNEVDTIDWDLRNVFTMVLDDTCEITFLTPTYPCHLTLRIEHDNTATNYPVTFSNPIRWEDGIPYVPSSSANAIDIISIYFDDTYYYATYGNDYK
jgi:hypothetical protein